MKKERKDHWENIYRDKSPEEVSWTQEIPKTSLDFIHSLELDKSAEIIDVGGGDSKLVDFLLEEGYTNITVLDISANALDKAKRRLGEKSKQVSWVVSDITQFKPQTTYDVWHDRATFHFLTNKEERQNYIDKATTYCSGFLSIGTFSENGPEKCSGLIIQQYNAPKLASLFKNGFDKIKCVHTDHITPFNSKQNFLFCSFKKRTI